MADLFNQLRTGPHVTNGSRETRTKLLKGPRSGMTSNWRKMQERGRTGCSAHFAAFLKHWQPFQWTNKHGSLQVCIGDNGSPLCNAPKWSQRKAVLGWLVAAYEKERDEKKKMFWEDDLAFPHPSSFPSNVFFPPQMHSNELHTR